MRYENGGTLFPPKLLRQIQRYASGVCVYIPSAEKRAWGETSGYRRYLSERNRDIKEKYRAGAAMERLAQDYFLSVETVRKIVYQKKEELYMDYECTLTSATQFANAGKLEEWVHAYLLSDGDNRDFSDGLRLFDRFYLGPMVMPLRLFTRCCGPEEGMRFRVNEEWFWKVVGQLETAMQSKQDIPPMIVHFLITEENPQGEFELNDGNHRYEACKRLGVTECPVIVWITEKEEKELFLRKYGEYVNKA